VLSCTPHEDQFAVILQSTIFHPQGGGQPFDTGWLGESSVLRVTAIRRCGAERPRP